MTLLSITRIHPIEHAEKGTMGMIKDRLPEPIPYAQPLTWDGWLR